jgi:hypothetical protein
MLVRRSVFTISAIWRPNREIPKKRCIKNRTFQEVYSNNTVRALQKQVEKRLYPCKDLYTLNNTCLGLYAKKGRENLTLLFYV